MSGINLFKQPLMFWFLAVCLALLIEVEFRGEASAAAKGSPLERIFGSSKEIFGDTLFLKADKYYHGGVIEKFSEDHGSQKKTGLIEDSEEKEHDHAHDDSTVDWIAKVNKSVQSHQHYHLDQARRKELLPFFALSTSLDPHNIEAILATAFWLETDFGKRDDAIELLGKGISDNPGSWELENFIASRYFNFKHFLLARKHYLKAIQKAEGKNLQYYEWVEMYYYLAETLLKVHQPREALAYYSKALQKLEGRDSPLAAKLSDKIRELS